MALLVAGALVAGHWVAELIAARWWVSTVAPSGEPFLTRWLMLQGALEALGLLVGATWFAGNLLIVARAIGSVELPRRIGDLDIREVVPPGAVLILAVVSGTLLGLLAGSGAGRETGAVLLAWHGLHFGLVDPVLGHDAALYVAQLPLWIAALRFVRILLYGAGVAAAVVYAALGALKVGRNGIAITDDARTHLGFLIAAAVGTFSLGTLLQPIRAVARSAGGSALPSWLTVISADTLAVIAAIGALLIGAWAVRGRSNALVAGLITTALVAGARVVLSTQGVAPVQASDVRDFTLAAWGLATIDDRTAVPGASTAEDPAGPGRWITEALLPAGPPADRVVAASRSEVQVAGAARRAWFVLRASADTAILTAVADDQLNAAGGPLSFRPGDPLAYPGSVSYASLPVGSVWPGAPDRSVGSVGIPVGGAARRLILAWAAQAGALLASDVSDTTRFGWHLDPISRLAQLLPPARWSEPEIILDSGRVMWAVPGLIPYAAFPLAPRLGALGPQVGGADPGLLGVVDARSGSARIFLLPGAGPVSTAWQEISGGLIEPADSIPTSVGAGLTYPVGWLALQAKILGEGTFGLPTGDADSGDLARPIPVWDQAIPAHQVAFIDPAPPGRVMALLTGEVRDRRLAVRLLRIPTAASLPGPRRLMRSWTAFPSFAQLVDSVQGSGARIIAGPVTYAWRSGRLEASHLTYRDAAPASPAVIWATVAVDRRLGAGTDLPAAWANLLGRTPPPPSNPGASDRLTNARVWVERADSALRRGDLAAFGRAFAALKELVEAP